MRGSISTHRLPASSVSSAGTLSMKTAAACRPRRTTTVVKTTGSSASRNASSSLPIASTTSVEVADERRVGVGEPAVDVDHEQGGRRPRPRPPWKPSCLMQLSGSGRRPLRERARAPPHRARAATSAAASPARRLEPGLRLAVREHVLERRPEVERERLPALLALARPLRVRGRLVGRPVVRDDDAVALLANSRLTSPNDDVADDRLDGPVEPVLPAAAAGRPVDEHVARLDPDVVALRRQHLLRPVRARRGASTSARRASPPSTPQGRVSQRSSWIETSPGSR